LAENHFTSKASSIFGVNPYSIVKDRRPLRGRSLTQLFGEPADRPAIS